MSQYCDNLNNSDLASVTQFYVDYLDTPLSYYAKVHKYVYQTLCIFGVFANILIIVVLLRPQMRKNPFNLILIAIAMCDGLLMATYLIYHSVKICHPWFFLKGWIYFTKSYAILSVFVHSVSLWLTVLMATLRYIVVNGNSSSKINWNSYKASAGFSLLAVIISFIGSAPNMIRYEVFDNGVVSLPRVCTDINAEYRDHFIGNNITHVQAYQLIRPSFWSCSWERIAHWFVGIILKFIPCILLTVFMSLLVRILIEARERRNRLCAARTVTCNTKTQAERTTAMLTIIVAVFLITELPQGIYVFMNGLFPSTHIIASKLGNFFDLLSLLNSSINFILYSTMSHQFRSNFIDMIAKYIPKTIERISGNQTIATTAVTAKSNKSKNGKDKDTTSKVQLLAISSTKCSQDNSSASKVYDL